MSALLLILQRGEIPHIMRWTLIPARVVVQVQLMIVLRIPPSPSLENLCRNGATFPPLLLGLFGNLFCLCFLLRAVIEDCRTVLRARIHALAVLSCWIVHLVEEFEEGGILDFIRVEDDLEGFGIYRMS